MTTIPPTDLVAAALGCAADSLDAGAALGLHPAWGSFAHLNLMMALEENYGVEINDTTVKRYASLDAVVARFRELTGARP